MCNHDCMRQVRIGSDFTGGGYGMDLCVQGAEKPDICGKKEADHDWFNRRQMHRHEYRNC